MEKVCATCGTSFPTNPRYSRAQQERARYCSRACQGKGLSVVRPPCACGCGNPVKETWRQYLQGHTPPSRQATGGLYLWQPPGRKPRWVFRDRQNRMTYFARAVMEGKIRRHLRVGEVVHHVNGDSMDDRLVNLQLYASHAEHMRDEYAAGRLIAMH